MVNGAARVNGTPVVNGTPMVNGAAIVNGTPKSITPPATSLPLSGTQTDPSAKPKTKVWETKTEVGVTKKRHGHGPSEHDPIECLVYRDPFSGVYKKYIFSADGKYLLGGMMVRHYQYLLSLGTYEACVNYIGRRHGGLH
jgi:hypothetical protein